MSESKKILYKRETATDALCELANRLTMWEYEKNVECFPIEINKVYIFGSYARGAERVHDLDVFVSIELLTDEFEDFGDNRTMAEFDLVKANNLVSESFGKYLKGGSRVLSLHIDKYAFEGERDIALSGVHYCIYKDGQVQYDVIDELLEMEVVNEDNK